jgi:hypothetical protein
MTPKEKAQELVNKFRQQTDGIAGYNYDNVNKQCALIAVDEAVTVCPYLSKEYCDTVEQIRACDIKFVSYWEEVKQEINNL